MDLDNREQNHRTKMKQRSVITIAILRLTTLGGDLSLIAISSEVDSRGGQKGKGQRAKHGGQGAWWRQMMG